MTGEELKKFVPDLIDARRPGQQREAVTGAGEDLGWVVQLDNGIALVRASQATHPFIWIRGGVAHAIPRSEDLALAVAAGNKDLVAGRLYLAYGDDLAMVVFDESIFGAYISLDYQPSIQDVVNRFETSLDYTSQWTTKIIESFGGQQFGPDNWGLMAF
jgi:hypothetical protein